MGECLCRNINKIDHVVLLLSYCRNAESFFLNCLLFCYRKVKALLQLFLAHLELTKPSVWTLSRLLNIKSHSACVVCVLLLGRREHNNKMTCWSQAQSPHLISDPLT